MRENLKAYIDNELSESQRLEVEAALANDQSLQAELDEFKQLGQMLKEFASQEEEIPVKGASAALTSVRKKKFNLRTWQVGSFLAVVATLVIAVPILTKGNGNLQVAKMAQTMDEEERPVPANMQAEAAEPAESRPEKTEGAMPPSRDQAKSISPFQNQQQQLVRTASVHLKVVDVPKAESEVKRITTSLNGFISSSVAQNVTKKVATAELAVRVPVKNFDLALDQLSKLGEIESSSSNAEDVTLQIADGEARLKVKKAEEESYITMLRATQKVGEMLEVKERLGQVREEIEGLTAQNLALNNMATYSTIIVNLSQRPKVEETAERSEWQNDSWANAVNGLRSTGKVLGIGAINLFVYSPIWLPILLLTIWLFRRFGSARR